MSPSPLSGKAIVITRPSEEAEDFSRLLTERGVEVIYLPLLETVPADFTLPDPSEYDWIFFTSRNGVAHSRLANAKNAGLPRIAVVGPATEQVAREHGLSVDFLPGEFNAESAAETFARQFAKDMPKVLWPCGNLANRNFARVLEARGVSVTPLVVYQTKPVLEVSRETRLRLIEGVDAVAFTSPSSIQAFVRLNLTTGPFLVACIGPSTRQAAETLLGRCDMEASPHTLAGLATSITTYLKDSP